MNAFISRRGVEDGTPEPHLKDFQVNTTQFLFDMYKNVQFHLDGVV